MSLEKLEKQRQAKAAKQREQNERERLESQPKASILDVEELAATVAKKIPIQPQAPQVNIEALAKAVVKLTSDQPQAPLLNIEKIAEAVVKLTPAQPQSPQINIKEIAEAVTKLIPAQTEAPQINIEDLAKAVVKIMPDQSQTFQINIEERIDSAIKDILAQTQTPQINIEELAKALSKVISTQPQAPKASPPPVDYKEIAKHVLNEMSRDQLNFQQNNFSGQDICTTKAKELNVALKDLNISFEKTKDTKEGSQVLYSLYKQLDFTENSYNILFDTANSYDDKSIAIKKGNKPLSAAYSRTKDGLLEVNTIMDSSNGPIKSSIAKVKSILPKEFITNFDMLASNVKDNSEIKTLLNDYCNICGDDLEKITENEQLILFSVCSAKIMVGLDTDSDYS